MSEAVRPSTLAAQPIGEASRVVEGVHQLKLPVPFPLKFVASYLIEGEPATAFEVARRVFPDELSDHQLRFALAETLAHLEHLVDDGGVERLSGEEERYRTV